MAQVIRHDFAKRLAKKTGLTQKESLFVMNSFMELVHETVENGDEINFVGFGRFYPIVYKSRMINLPAAGGPKMTQGHSRIGFRSLSRFPIEEKEK